MVRGYDTFKERLVYSQNGTSALTRDDFRRKLDPSATVPRMSFLEVKNIQVPAMNIVDRSDLLYLVQCHTSHVIASARCVIGG